MKEKHEFVLSAEEFRYLKDLGSLDELAVKLPGIQEGPGAPTVTVRLSRAEIEQLRGYLTVQLAAVGFDEDYSPNEPGKVSQNLPARRRGWRWGLGVLRAGRPGEENHLSWPKSLICPAT